MLESASDVAKPFIIEISGKFCYIQGSSVMYTNHSTLIGGLTFILHNTHLQTHSSLSQHSY